jgi:hypothetical protein
MEYKAIHVLAAAALVLASCSNDSTVEMRQSAEIRFRMAVGMNTRALPTDLPALRQAGISVSAFATMGNEKYEFSKLAFSYEEGSGWYSDPVRYWPEDGSELRFVAVSPEASEWGGTYEGDNIGELKVTGFSPETDIAKQRDLLAGYTSGSKNDAAGVGLVMHHALTQVEIRAKSSDKVYRYDVKAVRIGSVRSTGDYTFPSDADADGSWTLKDDSYASYTTEDLKEPVRLTADAISLMGDGGTAMLLPQQLTAWNTTNDRQNTANGSYIALLLKITSDTGAQVYPTSVGEYGWAAVAIGNNWQSGDKIIYTLDLSNGAGVTPPDSDNPGESILGSPIHFTVTVNGWTLRQQEENL